MLVLTRKLQEEICIGDNVKITVLRISGNSVRIGIEAPRDVRIVRGELELRGDDADLDAASAAAAPLEPAAASNALLPGKASLSGDRFPKRITDRWSTSEPKNSSTLSLLATRCRANSCRRQAS